MLQKRYLLYRVVWDQAWQWGKKAKKRGQIGKISASEVSGEVSWEGGMGGGARSHTFNAAFQWYQILVSSSDWSNLFMLTYSRCCWQYRSLSISRSYNSGKDFLKHGFRASNTNFFARPFTYPSAPRRAKNMPVICYKKKKKYSRYGASLTLSCDKLRSHL